MPLQFKVLDCTPSQALRLLKRLGHKVNKRSHIKSSLLETVDAKDVCVRVGKGHASIELFEDPLHIVTNVKNLENLISNKDNNE